MKRQVLGWIAVGTATAISSTWAFWGTFESFHEGWYFESLTENVVLTARYLTLSLLFTLLCAIAIRWPRAGGSLYALFGTGFSVWIFTTRRVLSLGVVLSWIPTTLLLLVLGALFWAGRARPARMACGVCVLAPLAVAVVTAVEPVARIAGRVDDEDRGQRVVEANGLSLIWAPEGPGWPRPDPRDQDWMVRWRGPTWEEARWVCQHLAADGRSVASTPQGIWRLPTVEEVVRSMARHGTNSGGVWDAVKARASYRIKPDKEPPLWNPHSPVIYWWTASEESERRAYSVDFEGNVYRRDKTSTLGSRAFRAVRSSRNE